jgi:hypothetical protein
MALVAAVESADLSLIAAIFRNAQTVEKCE